MENIYNEKKLVAIIGDIKKSRSLEKRKEVQEHLKKTLYEINKKYENDITAKFLVTLGDEFQGLLSNGKNVLKIIEEIRIQLHPVKLRFGIGIGQITTDINTEMALGADGPGYYHARAAITLLKDKENKKKTVPADICVKMDNGNEERVMLINTIFELMNAVERTWTDRQREIIWDMLRHQDGQWNTADRLSIAQSTVQKALAAGNYYTYENAMKNLDKTLGEIQYD